MHRVAGVATIRRALIPDSSPLSKVSAQSFYLTNTPSRPSVSCAAGSAAPLRGEAEAERSGIVGICKHARPDRDVGYCPAGDASLTGLGLLRERPHEAMRRRHGWRLWVDVPLRDPRPGPFRKPLEEWLLGEDAGRRDKEPRECAERDDQGT